MSNDWIIWVAQLGITLLMGALSWFVKRALDGQKIKDDQQDARIKELDDKLNSAIQQMPYLYVLREDFQRAVATQDKKLDNILSEIMRLQRKEDK